MSAPPYMPLYVGDYLADTTHLTQAETGAYLLLLMALWRAGGSLPADDAKLARFSRSTPKAWAAMRGTILEFFEVSDGAISQRRLTAELSKYDDFLSRQEKAGKASARSKSLKNKKSPSTGVEPALNQPQPLSEPRKEDREGGNGKSVAAPEPLPPPPISFVPLDGIELENIREMSLQAQAAAGDMFDGTRPAMHSIADLRSLVKPTSGEACTWPEVIEGIGIAAAKQRAKGRPFRSWKWVRDDVLAVRDARLLGTPPPSANGSRLTAVDRAIDFEAKVAAGLQRIFAEEANVALQ